MIARKLWFLVRGSKVRLVLEDILSFFIELSILALVVFAASYLIVIERHEWTKWTGLIWLTVFYALWLGRCRFLPAEWWIVRRFRWGSPPLRRQRNAWWD
jgi:hypothetical protein